MAVVTRAQFLKLFHEVVFGVEDSLVSTVGLLSGVAASGQSTHVVVMTGVILIFVEAFSMGAGSILADNSTRELETHSEHPLSASLFTGSGMFFSYLFAGLVPWVPYIFLSRNDAFVASIVVSIAALFILGLVQGHMSRISMFRQGVKMAVVGGVAILLGVFVGRMLG